MLPNSTYYVRVNQYFAPGYWDSSWTYMFQTGPACYGAQTSVFSTPAYGAAPNAYGNNYTMPSYGSSSTYSSGSSSFSLQPIDAWVRTAQAAMYYPSLYPTYIDCYPGPFPGCHLP